MANDMKQSLVTGLTSSPKYIPTWYNYDDVGSILEHESNHKNPDYYLSRNTISVLELNVQDIVPRVPYDLILVDLGSGNCSKTRIVIDELMKRQKTLTFYPVDISREFLIKAANSLSADYDDSLVVKPIAADYAHGLEQVRHVDGPKLILFFGSLINMSYDDQVKTLGLISTTMTERCRLVFTADITQDRGDILKAYNDDAGVKRNFIQHAIVRLNKEEGSSINLERFEYKMEFVSDNNPQFMSYVVAYIQANEAIRYQIPGLDIELVMKKGERLYFHEGEGFSCKYTIDQLQNIAGKARLHLEGKRIDTEKHAVVCWCGTVNYT